MQLIFSVIFGFILSRWWLFRLLLLFLLFVFRMWKCIEILEQKELFSYSIQWNSWYCPKITEILTHKNFLSVFLLMGRLIR